ncbi:DUF456 domain-containing protein [Streptomyces carpaticus]|uniref:Uncharacterized protein n=2 Tax=Streptomyces TaxID=1883 RepID=A0A1I6PQS1_9ACTN|nr:MULTISPECIES: DUF456 domain-containing protein [Streptomyces]QKV71410.1 DUF456 domain-containing protein [Streptomyces harbinensis]UWM51856.1 DUF456 domain-containing protein [Streptomyces carpaticus]SFS42470.1 hypothetical protein SAMN05444716_101662 [Streptomyces harbinensis]
MGIWQLLLVGLVMLLGLLGIMMPGVPGPLVVWAAVFWWSSAEGTSQAWWVLVTATALLLVNQAVQWLLPAAGRREAGVRRRQLLFAGGSGIVGFFVLPGIGLVPGFVGALYGWERARLGDHGAALASTRVIMRTVGRRMLVELAACLLVTGVWLGVLRWG